MPPTRTASPGPATLQSKTRWKVWPSPAPRKAPSASATPSGAKAGKPARADGPEAEQVEQVEHVGAVVGVAVGDDQGVEAMVGHRLLEGRRDARAGVEHHPGASRLDQVARAGMAGGGVGPVGAEDAQPHGRRV